MNGAWTGGWSRRKLAQLLRAAGHEVRAPTLTGPGERAHLARPDVDLDLHVTDLVNVLAYEDLRDATLVGWSYCGMVITGAAERTPERLAGLVYLDAEVPEDGLSASDVWPDGEEPRAADRAEAKAAGTPGFLPVPVNAVRAMVADEADREWVLAKSVPHPLATFAQPVRRGDPAAARLPRAYVFCTGGKDPGGPEPAYLARVRSGPGWRYRELAAAHRAPITAPRQTADLLPSLV